MDYEKAYKDALKRAREALNDGTISNNTIVYLQDIFPELTKNEDERIRKGIIKFLIDVNNGAYTKSELEIASWIAWLEKQGEQKPTLRERYENIAKSDWFKKTHEGMSVTIPDDLVGTDMDGGVVGEKGEQGETPFKEHIENLKKRIEDNQLGCIVQRLDRIIELLSWKPDIIPYPYTMPVTYKSSLDSDPNVPGGWTTSTFKNYKKTYEPPEIIWQTQL